MKLSVVILTYNEAHNIEDCVAGLGFADEIIVYDSGSTDDTQSLAKRLDIKLVVDTEWQGYGVQRQKAQSHASHPWILMLDADERVTPELAREIQAAVARDQQDMIYELKRLSWCFGRFIRHGGWYPDYVARLYHAQCAHYSDNVVHEKLLYPPASKVQQLDGDLIHYTYRDMEHYLVKSARYGALWAGQRAVNGKRASLLQGVLHGLGCFVRMYILRLGFLDGRAGFLLAVLSAHSTFIKYADLWSRTQPPRPSA